MSRDEQNHLYVMAITFLEVCHWLWCDLLIAMALFFDWQGKVLNLSIYLEEKLLDFEKVSKNNLSFLLNVFALSLLHVFSVMLFSCSEHACTVAGNRSNSEYHGLIMWCCNPVTNTPFGLLEFQMELSPSMIHQSL